jgi:hypothetical protein
MPQALSDVWRHFTVANVERKAMYICKYYHKSYVKNATKMQNPLAKCIKFPQRSQQATSKVPLLLFEVKMVNQTLYR